MQQRLLWIFLSNLVGTSNEETILIPVGLTTGKSAKDVTIEKKIYGAGTTGLIISNEEI